MTALLRRRGLIESLEERIVFNVANSLAELRAFGSTVNNSTVTLSSTGGDAHPVTGIVTPGEYWINGDHYADPRNSHPIFLELSGNGNTYEFSGTTIKLDTRKLDGFGRNLGHDSGIDVVRISGSNNVVQNLTLLGQDIALDTDPSAQRFADWSTLYVEVSGVSNTLDGAHVVTRGSRTDSYGLGDAFGKGASGGISPFIAHRKASALRVGDATDAVVNNVNLEVNTFGHGIFLQTSTNTTVTNSTITGELFPTQAVIDHPLYQQHGHTYWGKPIPAGGFLSGAEGGLRMYTGSSGLTAQNVIVTNMRTGFAVTNGVGTITLDNVEAYGTESAFNFKTTATITNAKGDAINGPLVVVDNAVTRDSSIEVELVGDAPINHDYALAYVSGNRVDINITSDLPASYFDDVNLMRSSQFWYENWRESQVLSGHEVAGYEHNDSVIINGTNMTLVLGEEASGNSGSSLGDVITNGKENHYDGISLVPTGKRTVVQHTAGLGNNGTSADGSLETNASIVKDGGTLEIQPGIRITDEKLTITGNGVDGKGALYSEGSPDSNTRFGSSNNSDETTIFLDGDSSIGAGVNGNQLLAGRIQGSGNLTKLGAGTLTIGKSSTFDGNLTVAEGHITGRPGVVHRDLTVAAGASISGIGNNTFNTQGDVYLEGQLNPNARNDNNTLSGKIGRLFGSGQILSSNSVAGTFGNLEIAFGPGQASFSGEVSTAISLTKSGTGTQILSGNNTYTGTTTVNGGVLQVDGMHTGGTDYSINTDGILGGTGSIDATIMVNAGGRVAPGASAGRLTLDDVTWTSGAFFDIELAGTLAGSEHDQLISDAAMLGGQLSISLLNSNGATYLPLSTDSFTVLTSSASLSGAFENVASGQRLETIAGEGSFLVTYGNSSNTVVLSDFEMTALDYGDAPASYLTLLANDGARHGGEGPRLGALRDLEFDGQPGIGASGDGDDEDGVMFGTIGIGNPMAGVNIDVQNTNTGNGNAARIDAWIDFDGDGTFQSGEKILDDAAVIAGLQTLNYSLPATAPMGETIARVRISSAGGLQSNGFAADGEVEDYQVMIAEAVDPAVESVVVNQGEDQRSRVTELTVTFNSEVTAPLSAFAIRDRGTDQQVNLALSSQVSNGKTVATLHFLPGPRVTNSALGLHSLSDGNFELVITGASITSGSRSMAADHLFGTQASDAFFRYFGDSDGDRHVDGQDYGRFGLTFLKDSSSDAFDAAVDFDGDNDVDGQDYGKFGLRFLSQLRF